MTGLGAQGRWRLPEVAPNGAAARLFLGFVVTAGLYYVNIMPVMVDALTEGLNFSRKQAGYVSSANVYGAAVGAFAIVFLVKRLQWRPTARLLLGGLLLMDLLSMLLRDAEAMAACRFLHGAIGGALIGLGYAVIARTLKPEKTFGAMLVIQFGLGGLGNLYLPRLIPHFGANVFFWTLVAFSVVALIMVSFLAKYETASEAPKRDSAPRTGVAALPLALILIAIFLFQAANMVLFAFIIGLGKHYGLQLPFITTTLAVSGWVGIIGALIVIGLYTRFGRLKPLLAAMLLAVLGNWALHFSADPTLFFVANCGVGITWALVIPYLLGMTAEFDKAGQMTALGGFVSKLGLASGPLAGGLLLGEDNYPFLIDAAVVALLLALLASLMPARIADRAAAG